MWIIHVNQQIIRQNSKYGSNAPVFRIQNGYDDPTPKYAREVIFNGSSKTVYSPDKPLKCGAKVWIESDEQPTLIDECNYSFCYEEVKKAKEMITS